MSVWYGVDGHGDNEDFQRLYSNLKRRRLAGLIFPTTPTEHVNTPLLDYPGVARVAVMQPNPQYTNLARLHLDYDSFLTRAPGELSRPRPASNRHLIPEGFTDTNDQWMQRLSQFGFGDAPYWVQGGRASSPGLTRNLVHLLRAAGRARAPMGC